eukprot:TRINITY_DN1221_c0_g5_i1.p1 TRINITY_DN1221_c0_g5~~TRINITY_DN1221_c0_g5_i1.p1  ORF type:complete len:287 (-),score=56.87 TRINITY_DN1221_c0_g5_i1:90-950(-)
MDCCKKVNTDDYNSIQSEDIELDPIPPKQTKEEELYSQRRCKRCGHYYTEATNDVCYYHPGRFIDAQSVKAGALIGWSCCNIEGHTGPSNLIVISNVEAFDKNAKGCKTAKRHEDDPVYSKAVSYFPFNKDAALGQAENKEPNQDRLLENKKPKKYSTIKLDENFTRHELSPTDTLAGLALKYNVSIAAIKRANLLTGDSIKHLLHILIPTGDPSAPRPHSSDKDKISVLIHEFKGKAKCSMEEAKWYLESNDYDMKLALKEYKSDVDWENSEGSKLSQKRASEVV